MKNIHIICIGFFLLLNPAVYSSPDSICTGNATRILPKIDIDQVQVGGEIGRRIDITVQNNILVLDATNDFLKPFQERKSQDGYIGLGKFIDSLVRLSVQSKNEHLLAFKNHVIEETIKTQEADGYIGIMVPERRMWALWDLSELSYIVIGLTSDYTYFHNQPSLDAAIKLANYFMARWQEKPDGLDACGITVFMAVTGLEEALLELEKATGDFKYRDFCVRFRKLPEWDTPIVLGRFGPIAGHAYAYLHRCLAQLRLYEVQPQPALLKKTQRVLHFLTHEEGLLINGVCSQHECWHNTQDGTEGLGETCSTAYLIRVLDEMIRLSDSLGREGDTLYSDIMERAIYNGLFAAQSPEGRRLRYYVPFEGPRVYFEGDTYCCPCNYRRIISELPGMIYYRKSDGVAVNLYTPSQTCISLRDGIDLQIQLETDYPNSGKVEIRISPSQSISCPIFLRIPCWCSEAQIQVNEETSVSGTGGTWFSLKREWKTGDVIHLNLPMTWRWVRGRQAQAGRVALMRGPQLFCLNRNKNPDTKELDLRPIYIDPETVEEPSSDDSIRPGGMVCRVKGWRSMGFSSGGNHDLDLTLTEFPDPDGVFTYFRIRQMGIAGVEDELMR